MTAACLTRVEAALWPRGAAGGRWAILDGARDIGVFRLLVNSYLTYSCLYSGPLAPELEIAAPYLVQLDHDDRATRQLIKAAWGRSWGIFLKADISLASLRRHLRHLLVVQDQRGKRLAFRYYDPRVLRVYLPTCTYPELETFFGPVECFWTEGESPEELLRFEFAASGLKTIPE